MALRPRLGPAGQQRASTRFVTRVQQQLASPRGRASGRCGRCGARIDITQDRVREYGVLVHLQCAVARRRDAAGEP